MSRLVAWRRDASARTFRVSAPRVIDFGSRIYTESSDIPPDPPRSRKRTENTRPRIRRRAPSRSRCLFRENRENQTRNETSEKIARYRGSAEERYSLPAKRRAVLFTRLLFPPHYRDNGGEKKQQERRAGKGENRGDEPDVRPISRTLPPSPLGEGPRDNAALCLIVSRARYGSAGTRDGATRHDTRRYDTYTSDTILGSRLSLTSSPPRVSRGRGELYPHRRCSGATWSRAWGRGRPPLDRVCIKPRE